MGGLLLKLQNFKKVKLIFGHIVYMYVYMYVCPAMRFGIWGIQLKVRMG